MSELVPATIVTGTTFNFITRIATIIDIALSGFITRIAFADFITR
jgi:hypothetical protein